MYAVVQTGGRQYRVQVGELLKVEKLPIDEGGQVELDRVLMLATGEDVRIGQPTVSGAKVMATALRHEKGPKLIVFKYKPKTRYRRKTGHRQLQTLLRIDQILS